jgi:streptogramin lyase
MKQANLSIQQRLTRSFPNWRRRGLRQNTEDFLMVSERSFARPELIFSPLRPRRGCLFFFAKLSCWRLAVPALAAFALLFTMDANAQTVQFSEAQARIPSSSLNAPHRVAVDSGNNVYISDTQNNRVLKQTWASDNSYKETIVASTGLNAPYGIAVDLTGDVFVADSGNARILKETTAGGSYVQTQVATSALNDPTGVAVDSLGNLYIDDTGNQRVLKETPSSGSYVETVVSSSGLNQVVGIAVDTSGNLFLSDVGNQAIYKETFSGGTYTQTTVPTSGLNGPYDIAVDAGGNLYISDFANRRIVKETPCNGGYTQSVLPTYALQGVVGLAVDSTSNLYLADTLGSVIWKESAGGANLGPVNVGTQSGGAYLIFSFVGGSGGTLTLGGTTVLTQGATGLDFSDSGNGNCSTSTAYSAGNTCAIGVFFTPQVPGQRLGAADLLDSSNNVLATGYVTGSGAGPQLNFSPGAESVFTSSATLNPQGLAVDASGNVFLADFSNDLVLKVTPLGVVSTVANSSSGMVSPEAVAVDGGGNIYIADEGNDQILKETPNGSGYVQTIVANFNNSWLNVPYGVAVDGGGNVFIADTNNSRILLETLSEGVYIRSEIPTSGLSFPYGVAVDLRGNIYIADHGNNRVVLETLSGANYTQSAIGGGLSAPTSVFVDGNGNVYIADYGNDRIVKETVSGSTFVQSVIPTSALVNPFGVAVDGNGNVFLSDAGNKRVLKEDFADPPTLNFSTTKVGSTSSDSPKTAAVLNIGNAPLDFAVPVSGTNPSLSTRSYVLDAATTCPKVTSSGPAGVLPANLSCTYAVDFSPIAPGANNDALVLTDNNLNVFDAKQSVLLSGTGLPLPLVTTTTLIASPSSVTFGQTLTLTATLSPYSSGGQTTNGESVTFMNGATTLGSGTLSSGVATLSLTTLSAGIYNFTAVYAGDANFDASTSSALVFTIHQAVPIITWPVPAFILNGSTLSATQLNATASVPGTFVYNPLAGTTPHSGIDTLLVIFTPINSTDYATTDDSALLYVYDFDFSSGPDASYIVVPAGTAATFSFVVSPIGLQTFQNPVTFSVTGLPAGTTGTFIPSSLAAGTHSATVQYIVQTSASGAGFTGAFPRGGPNALSRVAIILFCCSLLCLMSLLLFHKHLNQATPARSALLFVTLTLALASCLSGCVGIAGKGGQVGTTYHMVATANSGTLQHSEPLTLVTVK